ncbi:hypothetical protein SDC9_154678 [bioreactor metagenome]|uniref:Uncharacterized protein n=1 Tax=bioreactor metagenome TaxID=1076179 RepID=A0A645EZC5_9ZZZZ
MYGLSCLPVVDQGALDHALVLGRWIGVEQSDSILPEQGNTVGGTTTQVIEQALKVVEIQRGEQADLPRLTD